MACRYNFDVTNNDGRTPNAILPLSDSEVASEPTYTPEEIRQMNSVVDEANETTEIVEIHSIQTPSMPQSYPDPSCPAPSHHDYRNGRRTET